MYIDLRSILSSFFLFFFVFRGACRLFAAFDFYHYTLYAFFSSYALAAPFFFFFLFLSLPFFF